MNKRLAAGILWLFAGWYLGNLIAFQFALPTMFGPTLGLFATLAVAGDPFGLIWKRAARATELARSANASAPTAVPSSRPFAND